MLQVRRATTALLAVVLALLPALIAAPAFAATPVVQIRYLDGLFDSPLDPSRTNGVLATNDKMSYLIDVQADASGFTGRLSIIVPAGLQIERAPDWCASPQLSAVPAPRAGLSFPSLTAQTLSCQISQGPATTITYPVEAKLCAETPDGHQLGVAVADEAAESDRKGARERHAMPRPVAAPGGASACLHACRTFSLAVLSEKLTNLTCGDASASLAGVRHRRSDRPKRR